MPIEETGAMILLMQNSGGILVDKQKSRKQSEIIKLLVQQTSAYQLFAGRDLHKEPEKISDILSEIMFKVKDLRKNN